MKKIKNKSFHDLHSVKKFEHDLRRKGRKHTKHNNVCLTKSTTNLSSFSKAEKKSKQKRLIAPIEFSLVMHPEKALEFFDRFHSIIEGGVELLVIDMRNVETMTVEVLLYLISLQKINKHTGHLTNITVRAPKKPALRYLIAQSGFSKYFRANVDVSLKEDDIFTIRDGISNRENNIEDATTCAEAIDFALKFHKDKTKKDPEFRKMYQALAEMMTNTDNWAYNEEDIGNWYLFAAKVKDGISYYFFDNGQGIIKTAKKKLLERVADYSFSLGHRSLMRSILNGEYRSATGKSYRNKGLPEINDFLIDEHVISSIVLTNRVFGSTQEDKFDKSKYDFRGTLFAWILKNEEGGIDAKH